MPKWTTKPTEVAITAAADGALTVVFPVYRDGVKQFTQTQTITAGDEVGIVLRKAPGCVLTGFTARSDF